MMLHDILDSVFNGLLLGSSGYAMFEINPQEHPFAFGACAVGFCHVCVGICSKFLKDNKDVERAKTITTSCMQLLTLPLVNIELYRGSQQSNGLAMGHALFVIPLVFDVSSKLFDTETDESLEVLKQLTILGNMVSMLFFSVSEGNMAAGLIDFAAFVALCGSVMMDSLLEGTGENCSLVGYAMFFALLPSAVAGGGKGLIAF